MAGVFESDILRCEMQVSALFSAWDEHDVDAVMGSLAEAREISVHPLPATPNQEHQSLTPISYKDQEQIRTFVEALTPGFRSRVRNLQGHGPTRAGFSVDAVVTISADLLRNADIASAEASVFIGFFPES